MRSQCSYKALLSSLFFVTLIFPFVSITFLLPLDYSESPPSNSIDVAETTIKTNGTTADTSTESNVCLTPSCIQKVASSLARAYPDKTNQSAWILTSKSGYGIDNSTIAGIIYVKNFKAASSTAAGIALRIAHRHGDNNGQEPAWVKFSHVRGFKYAQRDPQHSLLITSLRDPAARSLSRIFYTSITQKGESPTDDNLLQKLRWNHRQYGAVSHEGGGYQVRYCSMTKDLEESWSPTQPHMVIKPEQVRQNVYDIIHAYDFILVAERMDESIVALAMILGLPLADVLVMDAKQNLGQEYLYFALHDRKSNRKVETCRLSIQAFRSPAVQAHLESTEWYAKNYGDYLLHAAALSSLDLTIERLGRQQFNSKLKQYQHLKAKSRRLCANETLSHCSSTGTVQRHLSEKNCYLDDSGCGYACIDRMLAHEPE
jgi:hypothetical protein